MDNTSFNLMAFSQHVGHSVRDAYTFSERVNGGRILGRVVAPPGAELWERGGPPKLKVPKPGRPGEYTVLEAADALTAARAGNYGLKFEGA